MCCPRDTFYRSLMKDREPTVRSRELGEGLRRAMEYAGFNGTQVAQQLGFGHFESIKIRCGALVLDPGRPWCRF